MNELLAAHRHTTKNRAELEASKQCGCCSCIEIFSPDEIVAYVGMDMDNLDDPEAQAGETALCPRCGAESLIGDKSGFDIDPGFLNRMNMAWFQKTLIRKGGPKR